MDRTKHTINELLVGLFNYITFIEERNLQAKGVPLSMNEVHLLENIDKASDNTMSHIAKRCMVTQGTLTTNARKLIQKGYVERYRDDKDGSQEVAERAHHARQPQLGLEQRLVSLNDAKASSLVQGFGG